MIRTVEVLSTATPFHNRPRQFENKEPIENIVLILKLLRGEENDRTKRLLVLDHEPPYIEIQHHCGGYTGEEYRRSTFFQVDRVCIDDLVEKRLIRGIEYTAKVRDHFILRITDEGQKHLQENA